MARPKLGETETERMQLKITAAEVEAIDDWRYSNRVPSRSEAVRRLCQIAIRLERLVPDLTSLLARMHEARYEVFERLENAKSGVSLLPNDAAANDVKQVAKAGFEEIHDAFHKSDTPSMDLIFLLKDMTNVLGSLTSGNSLEKNLEDLERRTQENERKRGALKQTWRGDK